MLFNSLEFIVFLCITFLVYWFFLSRHLGLQNLFVLVASYVFYAWWDWRFLGLIFTSSMVDYFVGIRIHRSRSRRLRKLLLGLSLAVNLGFLGFFKYCDFFITSFSDLCSALGFTPHLSTLNIILPVGISFYTFQTLSYTIDIYRGRMRPTTNPVTYLSFVSFFPQLVAGPIERASHLLPQFTRPRVFHYESARDGVKLILWGLLKKVVIADTCAQSVDFIFAHSHSLDAHVLFLGAVYFAIQIYGDFSGYSDIARGVASLLGFKLVVNFNTPYFSRNMAEFWRRWHISLSTWFRDYVYIPLGGNRCGKVRRFANLMATFVVSGFWHGANWTFVFWGFLHGLYHFPRIFFPRSRTPASSQPPWPLVAGKAALQTFATFVLTTVTWVFFRAESIQHAFSYIDGMASWSLLSSLQLPEGAENHLPLILVFLLAEWMQKDKPHPLYFEKVPVAIRWLVYLPLALCVVDSLLKPQPFIYFQF